MAWVGEYLASWSDGDDVVAGIRHIYATQNRGPNTFRIDGSVSTYFMQNIGASLPGGHGKGEQSKAV